MHLLVDGQPFQTLSRFRGVGRYAEEFIRGLAQLRPEHRITVTFNVALEQTLAEAIDRVRAAAPSVEIAVWESPARSGEMAGYVEDRRLAERVFALHIATQRPDVALCLGAFEGFELHEPAVPLATARPALVPTAAVLYDLIPYRFPSRYLPSSAARSAYERRMSALSGADLLLAISEFAAGEARSALRHPNVVRIDAGLAERFREQSDLGDGALDEARSETLVALYVGGFDWRKNIHAAVSAIALLPARLRDRLVFRCIGDGPEALKEALRDHWRRLGLSPSKLEITGHLSDDQLAGEYRRATFLIQPSLMEGFGLTALEAMACGCPALVSKGGALAEVVGASDTMFDPEDVKDIAFQLQRVLEDPDVRLRSLQAARLALDQYTWERTAGLAWTAIEQLWKAKPKPFASRPIRCLAGPGSLDEKSVAELESRGSEFGDAAFDTGGGVPGPDAEAMLICAGDRLNALSDGVVDRIEVVLGTGLSRAVDLPMISSLAGRELERFDAIRQMPRFEIRRRVAADLKGETVSSEWAPFLAAAESLNLAPTLFVDVSFITRDDPKTGIQRVVRHIARQLLLEPPPGWRVRLMRSEGLHFEAANSYQANLMGRAQDGADGDVVRFAPGDALLMLDSAWGFIDHQISALRTAKALGATIYFVMYDLIPVKYPGFCSPALVPIFEHWLGRSLEVANGYLCISSAVADELSRMLPVLAPERRYQVGAWPLGADFVKRALDDSNRAVAKRTSFLMVGTLEPRKGHEVALDAFEILWNKGLDVSLHIAGRYGWNVSALVRRIREHPEYGRRLFWHEGPSDEELSTLYRECATLIAASYAEGFGLPIVEATLHGMDVIASDIPVFREVAPEGTRFFANWDAKALSEVVYARSQAESTQAAPASIPSPPIGWQASARELIALLLSDEWRAASEDAPRSCNEYSPPALLTPLAASEARAGLRLLSISWTEGRTDAWSMLVEVTNMEATYWAARGDARGLFGLSIAVRALNDGGEPVSDSPERSVAIPVCVMPGDACVLTISVDRSDLPPDCRRVRLQMVQHVTVWWADYLDVLLPEN